MQISGKAAAGIAIVSILLVAAYGAMAYSFITGFVPPVIDDDDDGDIVDADTEFSAFKYTGVRKDATATKVTGATTRVWWDADADGFMDYDEIGSFTESSGVYTSNEEYPIGDFDLWVQIYASSYEVTYQIMQMSGARNSDGSAKNAGEIECIQTDDSLTFSGTINGIGWDDGTDYNYTLSGDTGEAKVTATLSAADKGISSLVWEAVDYETIYGISRDLPFYVKWDSITDQGIGDNSVLAPNFFGIYMTIQDKIDLSPTVSHFEFYGDDNTNWFGLMVVNPSWGDLFYNSDDASAPRPFVVFNVGTIDAAGTTVATYGIGIHTGLTYEQMESFKWTASATYHLGTAGDDWDWVA